MALNPALTQNLPVLSLSFKAWQRVRPAESVAVKPRSRRGIACNAGLEGYAGRARVNPCVETGLLNITEQ